jgi:fatty-acid desaturase
MPLEYLIYFIAPFIMGLVGEKYKHTSTKNYAIFMIFMLIFVYIYIALTNRPISWAIDLFSLLIYVLTFIVCTGLFHLQKVAHRIQKERQKAKLKNKNIQL